MSKELVEMLWMAGVPLLMLALIRVGFWLLPHILDFLEDFKPEGW